MGEFLPQNSTPSRIRGHRQSAVIGVKLVEVAFNLGFFAAEFFKAFADFIVVKARVQSEFDHFIPEAAPHEHSLRNRRLQIRLWIRCPVFLRQRIPTCFIRQLIRSPFQI